MIRPPPRSPLFPYTTLFRSIRLGHDRRLWRYASGVYRPDGDDWARQRTRELVGERFRRNHLEEITAWLRAQLPSLGHTPPRSEEHTSELQSPCNLVCRLLLE